MTFTSYFEVGKIMTGVSYWAEYICSFGTPDYLFNVWCICLSRTRLVWS